MYMYLYIHPCGTWEALQTVLDSLMILSSSEMDCPLDRDFFVAYTVLLVLPFCVYTQVIPSDTDSSDDLLEVTVRKWYVRTLVEFLASKNLCLQNCDLHVLYQYIVKLLQRGREVCAVQVIVLGLQDALGLPDKVPVVVPKQLSAKAAIGV